MSALSLLLGFPTSTQPCLETWDFLTRRLQNKALVPNRSTGDTGGLFKICEPVSIASGSVLNFHHAFVHPIMCSGALCLANSFMEIFLLFSTYRGCTVGFFCFLFSWFGKKMSINAVEIQVQQTFC